MGIALKINKIDEAIDCIETGILQNSDNGDLHYYLSKIYKKTGDTEDQIHHLKKALENKATLSVNPLLVSEKIKKLSKK